MEPPEHHNMAMSEILLSCSNSENSGATDKYSYNWIVCPDMLNSGCFRSRYDCMLKCNAQELLFPSDVSQWVGLCTGDACCHSNRFDLSRRVLF